MNIRPLTLVAAALVAAAPAQAVIVVFTTSMSGPNESPPNASPGIGTATVTWDTVLHTMRVQASFSGLTGTTTQAHIHAATAVPFTATAGVATQLPSFSGFPLGVTAGSMDTTFDMTLASSYNPTFVTNFGGGTIPGAETALFNAMVSGRAYYNIHSSTFPGGEIRGFLPTPGAASILAVGGLLAIRRRR